MDRKDPWALVKFDINGEEDWWPLAEIRRRVAPPCETGMQTGSGGGARGSGGDWAAAEDGGRATGSSRGPQDAEFEYEDLDWDADGRRGRSDEHDPDARMEPNVRDDSDVEALSSSDGGVLDGGRGLARQGPNADECGLPGNSKGSAVAQEPIVETIVADVVIRHIQNDDEGGLRCGLAPHEPKTDEFGLSVAPSAPRTPAKGVGTIVGDGYDGGDDQDRNDDDCENSTRKRPWTSVGSPPKASASFGEALASPKKPKKRRGTNNHVGDLEVRSRVLLCNDSPV
jgi:hypothetical protein